MKNRFLEILINILFWAGSAWIIVSSFSVEAQEIELVDGQEFVKVLRNQTIVFKLLLSIGIAFIGFYLNFWNISRLKTSSNRKRVILTAILILAASVLVQFLLEEFNSGEFDLRLPMAIGLGTLFFYFTVSCGYGLGRVWIQAERQKQKLEMEKTQVELNFLRHQLQPHFLFNALNNLMSMVEQQQTDQLKSSIERLSHLLRYVIEETRDDKVPIQKEIEFIRNYASLQLLRFAEDEVDFKLKISGDPEGIFIEPGLLINFVENAFKYGTEPENPSVIEVNFDLTQKGCIVFNTRNRIFNTFLNTESTGTGIMAIKRRLELVYANKHELEINRTDHYQLKLTIQTK